MPTVKAPTIGRPAAGIPASSEDHLRLMFDIMLLAFQMDRTRVATFMMNNDLSNMRFPSLDGVSGGIHELSHHANDEHRLSHYQRVNEHQVKLWAEFLAKMQATNEGERTLLENSMILLTSSLMDGNAHDSRQLPVVLAGGGGGTIQGGRFHDLNRRPQPQTLPPPHRPHGPHGREANRATSATRRMRWRFDSHHPLL
jgi:hypothetical protein